ncbi:hypothetical protein GCM10023094_55580 [Rhodococcus olei]|uniref:Uncharacterized protein n=1 Tax=Rhodococcus olei TaxID=2161675 RepID=A0ABP8PSV5_9NOCA
MFDQPERGGEAGVGPQVERDRMPPAAGNVELRWYEVSVVGWTIDAYYLSTHIGEHHGGPRARSDRGKLNHHHSV